MKDDEIIKLFLQHNKQALYETKNKYGQAMRDLIADMIRTSEDIRLCEKETYYALWTATDYPPPDYLGTHVLRLAKETAFKRLNGQSFKRRDTLLTVCTAELNEVLSDFAEDEVNDSVLEQAVKALLKHSGKKQRMLFLRRYWYFDSIPELSERFSMSTDKVKSNLSKLRKRLKKYIQKRSKAG